MWQAALRTRPEHSNRRIVCEARSHTLCARSLTLRMHIARLRVTISRPLRGYRSMKATTPERLPRTAVEAAGSIPASRPWCCSGRGRAGPRATSDWDIAILSHAPPENERAAKRLFGDLERVESIVMNPESIEAHCIRGTRLESAIARLGKQLAGALTTSRR